MLIHTLTPPAESLKIRIREISFQSSDSDYAVLLCKDIESEKIITVIGDFPRVKIGEHLTIFGQWTAHARFGKQFRVQYYESVMPTAAHEIESFLSSGLIKGVGPKIAQKMVAHFGDQTLQVLDHQSERLEEIPTIGSKKREQIIASWQERRGVQPIVQFLIRHGLSAQLGPRIYREYGAQSLSILQNRPYDLMRVWGLGFESVDRFAQTMAQSQGILWQAEGPERLSVGLRHILSKSMRDGHLFLPLDTLFEQASRLLGVKHSALVPALDALFEQRVLFAESELHTSEPNNKQSAYDIYLWQNALAEQESAENLARLLHSPERKQIPAHQDWLETYQNKHQLELSDSQKQAFESCLQHKVFILTGGPGTGKTTVSRAILNWFQAQNYRCKLASPTGRAAKRLSEVTSEEACTVHRLLEFDPHSQTFQRDESFPLSCDLLLLDEVSMLDMALFNDLLKALPDHARLVLIGDKDQLPSVGAGLVLSQLLQSQVIPVVQLTEIYRQAQASRIVQNAHLVNQGKAPVLLPVSGRHRHEDAFFVEARSTEQMINEMLQLVSQRLPAAGYSVSDIQVLCPMKKGQIGTQALNSALQAVLNPHVSDERSLQIGPRIYRVGDRVIQLKNNYELEVFNGDLGQITDIQRSERKVTVQFSDKQVELEHDNLNEIDLAYALTIHKSQGAEFPVVIMILSRQHHIMLQRNLLYTGMTRAQKLLLLIGESSAVQIAVNNDKQRLRYTHLARRLQDELKPASIASASFDV